MVDIQSTAAEIRRGKEKEERKIEITGQKYNRYKKLKPDLVGYYDLRPGYSYRSAHGNNWLTMIHLQNCCFTGVSSQGLKWEKRSAGMGPITLFSLPFSPLRFFPLPNPFLGVSCPLNPARGSGEGCKLPSRFGRSLAAKWILMHFQLKISPFRRRVWYLSDKKWRYYFKQNKEEVPVWHAVTYRPTSSTVSSGITGTCLYSLVDITQVTQPTVSIY